MLIQDPLVCRPEELTSEQLEERWDGRLLLVAIRAQMAALGPHFELTQFIPAVVKFPIRLSLLQTAITIENGKRIPLTPGMTVSAEIKTGTRAPIDYILAPLKKYGAESGRER